ncbi:MAG: carbon storage regulator [Bacillota bacterium]
MLVLQRKLGESIYIGDDIIVTVQDIANERVKISIDAPKHIPIMREELLIAKQNNEEASHATKQSVAGLQNFFKTSKK